MRGGRGVSICYVEGCNDIETRKRYVVLVDIDILLPALLIKRFMLQATGRLWAAKKLSASGWDVKRAKVAAGHRSPHYLPRRRTPFSTCAAVLLLEEHSPLETRVLLSPWDK